MLMTDEAQFLRRHIRDMQSQKESLSIDKRISDAVFDAQYRLLMIMEHNLEVRLEKIEEKDQDE